MKRHQPKHLYVDNQVYFISAHLADRNFRLDDDFKKDKLLLKIFSFAWENKISLYAWAILENHYHLLFKVSNGLTISKFIGDIHRGFTFEINRMEKASRRRLWKNYWDWCIRDESDYWRHFNYIHHNPIKHGLVPDITALKKYRYSSAWNYLRTKGEKWLMQAFEGYPILDFTVANDE
jgi:putative transposase